MATVSRAAGAVTAMIRTGTKTLCYSTARGGIRGWDLRSPAEAFRVRWDPSLGVVTALVAERGSDRYDDRYDRHDPRWFVAGTSAGCLALVDLRFAVRAAEWRLPGGSARPVDALAIATDLASLGSFPGVTSSRPVVWCASGEDEIAAWDVADGTCQRVLAVSRRFDDGDFRSLAFVGRVRRGRRGDRRARRRRPALGGAPRVGGRRVPRLPRGRARRRARARGGREVPAAASLGRVAVRG